MNNISTALAAHYAQDTTTLASCWRVTLTNGTVLGFTSSSSNIVFPPSVTYGGIQIGAQVTYLAATGHIPSAVVTGSDMSVDNLEVSGILNSLTITDAALLTGIWDYAQILLFEVNWADLTMGCRIVRSGTIGQVSTGRSTFTAELRGLMQNLQQTVGRVYGDTCDATFGDARCKFNASTVTSTGTVTSVADNRTFTASGLTAISEYYNFGLVTFTSGLNIGRNAEVRNWVAPNSFVMQLEFPYNIAIGDTFSVIAGCDKSLITCEATFNNSANFRGFFTVPGMDRMVTGT